MSFFCAPSFFQNVPNLRCAPFGGAVGILWIPPSVVVDYIFIQRTLILYSWDAFLTFFLFSLLVVEAVLGTLVGVWFGYGYQIPNSNFCAFKAHLSEQSHKTVFIVYFIVILFIDTMILFLTLHRLIKGGLVSVSRAARPSASITFKISLSIKSNGRLSTTLIRQGLHYYIILELLRCLFLVAHFTTPNHGYQTTGIPILAAIGPILAA